MAILGLADAEKGVPIVVRATAELGIGLIWLALCVVLPAFPGWLLPLALAVAGYVNVANFMDGVNGMSALHGFVSGSYFLVVGLELDQASISIAGVVTAAAFTGFAPWKLCEGPGLPRRRRRLPPGAHVVACGAAVFLVGGRR